MENLPVIALKSLAGNEPTQLVPMQVFLLEHFDLIVMIWKALWIYVVILLCIKLGREYIAHRKSGESK